MKMQRLFLIAIPLVWAGCVISCSSADKKKTAPPVQAAPTPISTTHASDSVEEIRVAGAKAAAQNAQRMEKEAKLAAPAPAPVALMAMREVAAPPHPIPKTISIKMKAQSRSLLKNPSPHLVLMSIPALTRTFVVSSSRASYHPKMQCVLKN